MTTPMTPSMPGRSHHSAPKFDGNPALLNNFFSEIEQLSDTCKLTEKQTIEWAIRYAPLEDVELWKQQESAKGTVWKAFKDAIYAIYPGSTGDRKYSITDLEMLVEKTAANPMESSKQYGEYYRAFCKIANFLKEKGRLTDREISGRFLQGFNFAFRNKVRAQLRAENPTHHTDDPYQLSEISSAAQFILSCNHDDMGSGATTTLEPAPTVTIKREQFDVSDIGRYFAANQVNLHAVLAQEVAKYMNTMQVNTQVPLQNNAPSPAVYNAAVANTFRPNDRPRTYECIFCSDPTHYLNSCPIAYDFVQKGLCKRNSEGQIVLPNGERVNPRTMFGRNLKERIEGWHASNTNAQNIVSTNLVSIAEVEEIDEPIQEKSQFVWIEVEDEENKLSEREREELNMMESLITSTQKKVDDTKRKLSKSGGPQTRSAAKRDADNAVTPQAPVSLDTRIHTPTAVAPQNVSMEAGTMSAVQYKFVTPIESAAITDKIAKQSMDATINLTMRDVLAIAPDVRKILKEQITTKKIAQQNNGGKGGALQTFMTELPPTQEGLKVANHSEELRAIDVLVHGVRTVEGILDDGSQIMAIRKDIWESLGLAARSDYQVVMEAANNTTATSIGLLHNLKITIAGYDFYVQAQVIDNAPYEMLIGLPFKILTQSTTQHFEDGSSHITMKDPNTGAIITLPTRERKRAEKKASKTTGF